MASCTSPKDEEPYSKCLNPFPASDIPLALENKMAEKLCSKEERIDEEGWSDFSLQSSLNIVPWPLKSTNTSNGATSSLLIETKKELEQKEKAQKNHLERELELDKSYSQEAKTCRQSGHFKIGNTDIGTSSLSTIDKSPGTDREFIIKTRKVSVTLKKEEEKRQHALRDYHTDLWEIRKKLTKSDVDDSCRLLLSKDLVHTHVLPYMDKEDVELCMSTIGHKVDVWDVDTGAIRGMVLKMWSTNSYVMTGNWKQNFVKRRNLEQDDEIGLFWDRSGRKFFFSLLKKKHNEGA